VTTHGESHGIAQVRALALITDVKRGHTRCVYEVSNADLSTIQNTDENGHINSKQHYPTNHTTKGHNGHLYGR